MSNKFVPINNKFNSNQYLIKSRLLFLLLNTPQNRTQGRVAVQFSHHHIAEYTPKRERDSENRVIVIGYGIHSDDFNALAHFHDKVFALHLTMLNLNNIRAQQCNSHILNLGYGNGGATTKNFAKLFSMLRDAQKGWIFKKMKIVMVPIVEYADMLEINSKFGLIGPTGHFANYRTSSVSYKDIAPDNFADYFESDERNKKKTQEWIESGEFSDADLRKNKGIREDTKENLLSTVYSYHLAGDRHKAQLADPDHSTIGWGWTMFTSICDMFFKDSAQHTIYALFSYLDWNSLHWNKLNCGSITTFTNEDKLRILRLIPFFADQLIFDEDSYSQTGKEQILVSDFNKEDIWMLFFRISHLIEITFTYVEQERNEYVQELKRLTEKALNASFIIFDVDKNIPKTHFLFNIVQDAYECGLIRFSGTNPMERSQKLPKKLTRLSNHREATKQVCFNIALVREVEHFASTNQFDSATTSFLEKLKISQEYTGVVEACKVKMKTLKHQKISNEQHKELKVGTGQINVTFRELKRASILRHKVIIVNIEPSCVIEICAPSRNIDRLKVLVETLFISSNEIKEENIWIKVCILH